MTHFFLSILLLTAALDNKKKYYILFILFKLIKLNYASYFL
jgi:hypothetical protein